MKACERLRSPFTIDVTPKGAAGYESRSPVVTNLSRHDQIADGNESGDLRQYFRWEVVDGSKKVLKRFELWNEVGELLPHLLHL